MTPTPSSLQLSPLAIKEKLTISHFSSSFIAIRHFKKLYSRRCQSIPLNCKLLVKVPDSIEVVRNILSELEADAEDRPETEEEEGEEDEVEVEEVEECTCSLQVSTKSRVEGSLVVDVHQGAVHRCSKHTAERFPR